MTSQPLTGTCRIIYTGTMNISPASPQYLSEMRRREALLTKHNGNEAVYIIGFVDGSGEAYAGGCEIGRAYAAGCTKYLVAEHSGAVRELRVGDGEGTHSRMILPSEGERLVGAGYFRYCDARAMLELYGQSGSFPMEPMGLVEERLYIAGVQAANPCGLIAVQSAITAILPTITIRATLRW